MGRTWKKKINKRKKNSSSGDELGVRKLFKAGGHDRVQDGKAGESDSDETELDVSQILNKANSILYDDHSVFEETDLISESEASIIIVDNNCAGTDTTNMAANQAHSSSPSASPTNADIIAYLKRIDTKIENVETKLQKLDSLKEKVNHFENDMKKMWLHIDKTNKETNEKVNKLDERMDNAELRDGQQQSKLQQLEEDNAKLKDSISYLQSQSMRSNLIFCNIPEQANEKPADTEDILRNFMVKSLKMAQDQVNEMKLDRAHRMGRQQNGTRKIVCKFNLFKDREVVRQKRTELKDTNMFIHEQFPPDIVAKRKK